MKIDKKCKRCKSFWTHGAVDGKHNRWCCAYGKPAYKAISHCKNNDYNKFIEKD